MGEDSFSVSIQFPLVCTIGLIIWMVNNCDQQLFIIILTLVIVVMTMMEIIVIAIMLMINSYSYGPSLGGKNGNLAGLGSKVKCIPFRPEQTQSRSILSFDHLFLKVMKSHLLLNKTQLHTYRGRACGGQLKQRFYEETFNIHLRVRTAPVITVEKYKIASDLYCVAQNNNNNSLDEDFHHQ